MEVGENVRIHLEKNREELHDRPDCIYLNVGHSPLLLENEEEYEEFGMICGSQNCHNSSCRAVKPERHREELLYGAVYCSSRPRNCTQALCLQREISLRGDRINPALTRRCFPLIPIPETACNGCRATLKREKRKEELKKKTIKKEMKILQKILKEEISDQLREKIDGTKLWISRTKRIVYDIKMISNILLLSSLSIIWNIFFEGPECYLPAFFEKTAFLYSCTILSLTVGIAIYFCLESYLERDERNEREI